MNRDEPPNDDAADMLADLGDRICEIVEGRMPLASPTDWDGLVESLTDLVAEEAQRLKDADVCGRCFVNELAYDGAMLRADEAEQRVAELEAKVDRLIEWRDKYNRWWLAEKRELAELKATIEADREECGE